MMGRVDLPHGEDPAKALRRKALAYLRAGRVTINLGVASGSVVAMVETSRADSDAYYIIDGTSRGDKYAWVCTCKLGRGCPHIEAVRMVTDHGNSHE